MNNTVDKQNLKHIKNIENCLGKLAATLDSDESFELERLIVKEIGLLSDRSKKDNSELLQPLHLYFIALYSKGRISLDKSADNPSISLFTDFFTENKEVVKMRFERIKLQKVILTLIQANLSIHRVQHANLLLDCYYDIFSEDYKSWLYIKILDSSCGSLDIKHIEDLFKKTKDTYEKYSSISAKADFLYKIYYLSKGTLLSSPEIVQLLESFIEESKGECNSFIRKMYREFCLNNERLKETGTWIQSIREDNLGETDIKGLAELRYILEEKAKGNRRIRQMPSEDMDDNAPYLNAAIKKHYADKTYSREALLSDIEQGISFYHEKTLSDDSLDNKINSLIIACELKLMYPLVSFWAKQKYCFEKLGFEDNGSDSIFIAINEYSMVNAASTFPFLLEARRRGIPCYSFSPKIQMDTCSVEDSFYELYGMVNDGRDKRYLPNNDISDVEIDIRNKRIIVDGMNIYQPVFEIVSRYQFTYEFRYDSDAWARYRTVLLIRRFKALFDYIRDIERWAIDNGKKIYFISTAPHIHNAAAFRIYCEDRGVKSNLYFICTSPGYDNYFLNSTDPRSLTTTALNMTRHIDARNSFLGTKEGFEAYYRDNLFRVDEIRQKMKDYLVARRSVKDLSLKQRLQKIRIISTIEKAHKQGKTVILLNGKVIIDLGVKYTKGCVHNDMSEWITHAVSFANANKDKVLLIIVFVSLKTVH